MLPKATLLALLPFILQVDAQASGTGKTTRYWDCCKASCGWKGKATLASGSNPVGSCDAKDNLLTNYDAKSGCNSGVAYMCSNQSPWAVSETLAYGFAATTISGGKEASWCCACYELTFTSGAVAGKKMIVQATNTGGDLAANQFDIAMPGGGFGIFNGCTAEWGTPSGGWGAQYGGVSSRSQCDSFPDKLKQGCYWRFDWFGGSDNPAVTFKQVACPAAITAKSGCVRAKDVIDETPTGPASTSTWTKGASAATSAASTPSTPATGGSGSGSGATPVAQYGQCGGSSYVGTTECAAGFTCTVSNEFYSQCL
ncbi:RlpA-like double-psi beta-barrel-protein domain-containing protein-containing protein [Halenospora varia]|nr:RlpA-like double-psi beta-barrel-protein domain-containing protein-containing protein [Halenospora varia]